LDLAVAVSWSRGPRFASPVDATVPFEVTPPFVSMPRNPVQLLVRREPPPSHRYRV